MDKFDGKIGEEIALQYLLERGMALRERNWRVGHLEVDLIMEDEASVRIVEVRSLRGGERVLPKDTVMRQKQRFLTKAASAYASRYKIRKDIYFDIVSIVVKGDKYELEYIPEAFYPICL